MFWNDWNSSSEPGETKKKYINNNKFDSLLFIGDGLIQHRELQHVMRACMEENGMQFSEDQVEDLTMALFEDADSESRGAITYEALKNQLQKHNGLLENLSIR